MAPGNGEALVGPIEAGSTPQNGLAEVSIVDQMVEAHLLSQPHAQLNGKSWVYGACAMNRVTGLDICEHIDKCRD